MIEIIKQSTLEEDLLNYFSTALPDLASHAISTVRHINFKMSHTIIFGVTSLESFHEFVTLHLILDLPKPKNNLPATYQASTHQILELRATENLIKSVELTLECSLSSCRAINRTAIPNENKPICVEKRSQLLHHFIQFCSSQNTDLLRFTATGTCDLSSDNKAQIQHDDYNNQLLSKIAIHVEHYKCTPSVFALCNSMIMSVPTSLLRISMDLFWRMKARNTKRIITVAIPQPTDRSRTLNSIIITSTLAKAQILFSFNINHDYHLCNVKALPTLNVSTLICVTKSSNIATSNGNIYYECKHNGLRATVKCSNMIMSLQVKMKNEGFRPIMVLLIMYGYMKLTVPIMNTSLISKNVYVQITKLYGGIQIKSKMNGSYYKQQHVHSFRPNTKFSIIQSKLFFNSKTVKTRIGNEINVVTKIESSILKEINTYPSGVKYLRLDLGNMENLKGYVYSCYFWLARESKTPCSETPITNNCPPTILYLMNRLTSFVNFGLLNHYKVCSNDYCTEHKNMPPRKKELNLNITSIKVVEMSIATFEGPSLHVASDNGIYKYCYFHNAEKINDPLEDNSDHVANLFKVSWSRKLFSCQIRDAHVVHTVNSTKRSVCQFSISSKFKLFQLIVGASHRKTACFDDIQIIGGTLRKQSNTIVPNTFNNEPSAEVSSQIAQQPIHTTANFQRTGFVQTVDKPRKSIAYPATLAKQYRALFYVTFEDGCDRYNTMTTCNSSNGLPRLSRTSLQQCLSMLFNFLYILQLIISSINGSNNTTHLTKTTSGKKEQSICVQCQYELYYKLHYQHKQANAFYLTTDLVHEYFVPYMLSTITPLNNVQIQTLFNISVSPLQPKQDMNYSTRLCTQGYLIQYRLKRILYRDNYDHNLLLQNSIQFNTKQLTSKTTKNFHQHHQTLTGNTNLTTNIKNSKLLVTSSDQQLQAYTTIYHIQQYKQVNISRSQRQLHAQYVTATANKFYTIDDKYSYITTCISFTVLHSLTTLCTLLMQDDILIHNFDNTFINVNVRWYIVYYIMYLMLFNSNFDLSSKHEIGGGYYNINICPNLTRSRIA